MERCFFHCFWVFLSRDPSCCDVRLMNVGRGGRLQVVFCLRFFVLVVLVLYMMFAIGW